MIVKMSLARTVWTKYLFFLLGKQQAYAIVSFKNEETLLNY